MATLPTGAFPPQGRRRGGAMDLAACAQRVFIALEHTTRRASPGCSSATLPIHSAGCRQTDSD